MSFRFAALAALALLGACAAATPPWTKPDAPPSQVKADHAACRDRAEGPVPPAMEAFETGGPRAAGVEGGRNPGIALAERRRTAERISRSVADCMRGLGYVRTGERS